MQFILHKNNLHKWNELKTDENIELIIDERVNLIDDAMPVSYYVKYYSDNYYFPILISQILNHNCEKITSLNLKLFSTNLDCLKQFINLKHLTIAFVSPLGFIQSTTFDISGLCYLQKLESITFDFSSMIIDSYEPLKYLPNLKIINNAYFKNTKYDGYDNCISVSFSPVENKKFFEHFTSNYNFCNLITISNTFDKILYYNEFIKNTSVKIVCNDRYTFEMTFEDKYINTKPIKPIVQLVEPVINKVYIKRKN